jgi:hypothetical protein
LSWLRTRSPVLLKILIGAFFGGAGLAISLLASDKAVSTLTTVVVLGGVSFAASEMIDVKNDQARDREDIVRRVQELEQSVKTSQTAIEGRIEQVAAATRIISGRPQWRQADEKLLSIAQSITHFDPQANPLAWFLVEKHLERVIERAAGWDSGEIVYEGEDRDMLLDLTAAANKSVFALSPLAVDGPDFWASDLGMRFLELQYQAVTDRGVAVRRLFVVDSRDRLTSQTVRKQVATQEALGFQTRVLSPEDAPIILQRRLTDFTVFDLCASYELTSSTRFHPLIVTLPIQTKVIFRAEAVAKRAREFQRLWEAASHPTDEKPQPAA